MAIKLIIRRKGAAGDAPPLAEQFFDETIITIGRDGAANLCLDEPSIAPEQAIILNEDGHLLFINRAPGTTLNGEALTREARRPLAHGALLDIGPYLISIDLRADEQRPAAAAGVALEQTAPPAPRENAGGVRPFAETGGDEATETAPERGAQGGSFAAILDGLRTEEDSFYFEIVSATRGRRRVVIENAEMLIGWDETGRQVSCDAASIRALRARVRKDWSGVVVQPHSPGTIEVNGETVEAVRRLRNGDRLTLLPTAVATDPQENFLIFHEPATLVVLDSLLPQQLPPPVAPVQTVAVAPTNEDATIAQAPEAAPTPGRKHSSPQRRYFGYFTFGEVLIMITGTLLAAVIIFLILEFL